MKKKIIAVLAMLLLVPLTSAAEIQVSPDTYSKTIVAGEDFNQTIHLNWNGETSVVGKLNTTVTQENGEVNGKEFNISYSSNQVILNPDKEKEVKMAVTSSPATKPDKYYFKTKVKVEKEVEHTTDTDTHYVTEYVTKNKTINNTGKLNNLSSRIDELLKTLEQKKDELNETKHKLSKVRGERISNGHKINRLGAIIENKEFEISDLESKINKLKDKTEKQKQQVNIVTFVWSALVGILAFVGFLAYDMKFSQS